MAFQSRGGKDRQDSDRRDFLKVSAAGISSLFLLDRFPVCVPAAEKQKEPLVDQVRDAIKRGVQYLRDRERGNGAGRHRSRARGSGKSTPVSTSKFAI